ncbi:MAG: cyanophycinase [bacterium]|nr:cyanophycinase [bacterium]
MAFPSLALPIALLSITLCWLGPVWAQSFDERFSDWPVDLKIQGKLIVANTLSDMATIAPLLDQSRREQSLLLVAPADQQSILVEQYDQLFDQVIPVESLTSASEQAGVEVIAWHVSPYFQTAYHYLDRYRRNFQELLDTGKTLIVVGPNAAWCSKMFLANDELPPSIKPGANFLLDCLLHMPSADSEPASEQAKVLSVLTVYPRSVGILLDSETALKLDGRKIQVAGAGAATFLLAGNTRQPNRVERVVPRSLESRQRVTEWLLDLTEWRRDAIDRTLEEFPSAEPGEPCVDNGKLFIVGGGGLPEGLMESFVQAAGGPRQARLVYVPCSEAEVIEDRPGMLSLWEKMGVAAVDFIHTKDRQRANDDEQFYAPLESATGVWFGGGRQWNFADSYYGTTTHRLMKEVLTRGGAIGGSSAGASVQARYLARATPIENFRIMALGYERGGLGFLSGVAIDQHFTQRRRQKDMTQLVDRYPQLLGIGIDETTALVVEKSLARVVGQGQVYFYDRNLPVCQDRPDYIALQAGQIFDLAERKVVESE